jgi:hypothetical protein
MRKGARRRRKSAGITIPLERWQDRSRRPERMDEQSVKPTRELCDTSPSNGGGRKGKRGAEHPIAVFRGIFKDDPLWDEFAEAMQRARAAEDARGNEN